MRLSGEFWIIVLLSIIFFGAGMGLSIWGWNILQNAQASSGWPGVPGQVLSAAVDSSTDSDGDTTYSAEIVYAYSVNGRGYENNTIRFGQTQYSSYGSAEEALERYTQNRSLTVYFNPHNPQESVLEPGTSFGSYLVLGVGIVFMIVPFFLMISRMRQEINP